MALCPPLRRLLDRWLCRSDPARDQFQVEGLGGVIPTYKNALIAPASPNTRLRRSLAKHPSAESACGQTVRLF